MPWRRPVDSSLLRLPPYPYFLKALIRLLEAFDHAAENGRAIWDSAVKWPDLYELDIPSSAMSWLMDQKIISHAYREKGASRERRFRRTSAHAFHDFSYIVIVPKAVGQVRLWIVEGNSALLQDHEGNHEALFGLPYWNKEAGELWFEYDLIKVIPEKAANQRKVLDWCQENQWRQPFENCFKIHADKGDYDPDALHNALARLNANQINRRLHFYRDGSGMKFRFEIIPPRTKVLPIRK